jgi:hypothetical protein
MVVNKRIVREQALSKTEFLNVPTDRSIIKENDYSYSKEITQGCPHPIEVGARPGLPLLKKVVNEVYLNQGKKTS